MDIRKPDAKGRIVVGADAEAYTVAKGRDGTIVLSPVAQPEPTTYKFVAPASRSFASVIVTSITESKPGVVRVTPELIGSLIDAYADSNKDHCEGQISLDLRTEVVVGFLESIGFRRTMTEDESAAYGSKLLREAVEKARSTNETVPRRGLS